MSFIPYTKPWITEEDRQAVADTVAGPIITRGPKVEAFEKGVAARSGAPFAVAFNSGTSALHAAYYAAGMAPHDTVITSPNTFVGTLTGALHLGAHIAYADVDPLTGNLDPTTLPASKGRTLLVPNHFGGSPLTLKPLSERLVGPDDLIIEDACHAFGAAYEQGKPVGSDPVAAMTVFSFHPAKTITTGEGGIVVTHHEKYVARLRAFRNNGITYSEQGEVEVSAITGNFHMTEMQAALGLSQLDRTETIVARRKALHHYYGEHIKDYVSHLPYSAHHLFCARVHNRDEVRERLTKAGIGTQIHYIPLYRQPALKGEPLEGCETYFQKTLTLPLYYELTEEEIQKIVGEL